MRIALALFMASLLSGACKKTEDTPGNSPRKQTPPAEDARAAKVAEADPALVDRGRYLSDLMGCQPCHTAYRGDKAFAGGLEVSSMVGTWRSPNITQDTATGIGNWTDEQIIAAVREGKHRDGTPLNFIMPYLYFYVLSDEDAAALVAFLRTIEPIANEVQRSDEGLPKLPPPPAKGLPASTDDPVAHGSYLASLMRCSQCHSPFKKGTLTKDESQVLAGGMPIEWKLEGEGLLHSSNLTPDPETGIGNWADEELGAAILQMKKRDGSLMVGPMRIFQSGWSQMTARDLEHLIAYLRSIPPIRKQRPPTTFKPYGAGQASPR